MLKNLKQSTAAEYHLKTTKFMSDYEKGAISAFQEEFPGIVVKGLIKSTPRVSQSNKLDLFTSYFRSTWF